MMLTHSEDRELKKIVEKICSLIEEKYPHICVGYCKKEDGVYRIFHDQYDLEYFDEEFDRFINKLDKDLLGVKYTAYAYVIYDKNAKEKVSYTNNYSAETDKEYSILTISNISFKEAEAEFSEYFLKVVETLECSNSKEVMSVPEAA